MVHATGSKPLMGYALQLDDIVFTQADAGWVHNSHEDAWLSRPRFLIAWSIDC